MLKKREMGRKGKGRKDHQAISLAALYGTLRMRVKVLGTMMAMLSMWL